jgi:hypothetical protein
MPAHIDELQVRGKVWFDCVRALPTSPVFAYSRHDLTPCRSSMLTVG